MKKRGISLIILIITIIVLLIITTTVILTLINNNIIDDANRAVNLQELTTFKEELDVYIVQKQIDNALSTTKETSLSYNIITGEEVKNVVTSVPDELIGKVGIVGNKVFYLADEVPSNMEELEKMGYDFLKPEDLEYAIELQLIENVVELSNRYSYVEIGKKLGQSDIAFGEPSIEYIAGIGYGRSWTLLGEDDSEGLNTNVVNSIESLDRFILTEEEKSYFKHSPYVINYTSGAVLSIKGEVINANTSKEIWTPSFNYLAGSSGFVTDSLLSGVIDASLKDDYNYGEFKFNTTGSSSSNFDYEEDKYGNVGLELGESVGTLEIDQSIKINERYTISLLIKGPTNQISKDIYAGPNHNDGSPGARDNANTIIAVSDVENSYIAWIGIITNRLRIQSFNRVTDLHPSKGYLNIDVSEYDNKYMYIQVVAERGEESKLYINGVLKGTYTGGTVNGTYKSVTIGDLRPGRGIKYEGNIYDIAIYGEYLTEEQLQSNWQYVKEQYNLNDDGSQN